MQQQPLPSPSWLADPKLWIALAALVQPWVIALYKRFVLRGRLRVYEVGNIEIGFSSFGPTIGILGSLNASQRDVFVKGAEIVVVREKDQAQAGFRWFVQRPFTWKTEGVHTEVQPASAIAVKKDSSVNFSTLFTLPGFAEEHAAVAGAFTTAWNESELSKADTQDTAARLVLLSKFSEVSPTPAKLWEQMLGTFFWQPGDYTMTLSVLAEKPTPAFTKRWRFRLSADDTNLLKGNITMIVRTLAGIEADFKFAYPQYDGAKADEPRKKKA